MQRQKINLMASISIIFLMLSGCFPGVYKIDIQQGNIITQEMINQLRPGMTKAQVRYLMGSPMIADTFHASRWDYIFSIQPGGGKIYQENVSLLFDREEQLVGLSGDFLPGTSRDEAILGGSKAGGRTDKPTIEGSVEEQIQHEVDSVDTIDVPVIEGIEY